jgi:hypothetical protein
VKPSTTGPTPYPGGRRRPAAASRFVSIAWHPEQDESSDSTR